MTLLHYFARAAGCFALTAAASLAHAAPPGAPSDPADPDAAVPAVLYQPVMRYQADAGQMAPAQNWKTLNDEVGAIDSMSLTMGAAPAAQPAATTRAAPPASAPPQHPERKHQHRMEGK